MGNSEISKIFDVIETYLARYQYRIMDGTEDSLFIRSMTTGEHYVINITEIVD